MSIKHCVDGKSIQVCEGCFFEWDTDDSICPNCKGLEKKPESEWDDVYHLSCVNFPVCETEGCFKWN